MKKDKKNGLFSVICSNNLLNNNYLKRYFFCFYLKMKFLFYYIFGNLVLCKNFFLTYYVLTIIVFEIVLLREELVIKYIYFMNFLKYY